MYTLIATAPETGTRQRPSTPPLGKRSLAPIALVLSTLLQIISRHSAAPAG
jgi:hypothetical protein